MSKFKSISKHHMPFFIKNTILLGGHGMDFFFHPSRSHKQLGEFPSTSTNFRSSSSSSSLSSTSSFPSLAASGSSTLAFTTKSTKARLTPPEFTNMTDSWKIPPFSNRKYIDSFRVHFPASHVSFPYPSNFFAKVPCKGTFAEGDFIWTNHQFSGEYKLVFNGCKKKLCFIATSPGFESNRDTAEKRDFGRCLFLLFDLFFFLLLLLLCLLLPDLAHFFSAWRLQSLKS